MNKSIVKLLLRLRQYIKEQEAMYRHGQTIVKWPSEEEQKMEKLKLNRKSIQHTEKHLTANMGKHRSITEIPASKLK